ncbi:MAG TPA: hypothetical protein VI542_10165 [Candidatus Tectomicrobia bacterium]
MREPSWEAVRQQLIRLLRTHTVSYGPSLVGPGVVTDVLIDPSRVTLHGDGLALIASLLVPLLKNDHVEAGGGPAMGAIPLVTMLACQQWSAFYIRLGAHVHRRRSPIGCSA